MLTDLKGRAKRLEALTQGLALEVTLRRAGGDPLLYVERRDYLAGLQDAIEGLESARVVLAQAAERLAKVEAPAGGRLS